MQVLLRAVPQQTGSPEKVSRSSSVVFFFGWLVARFDRFPLLRMRVKKLPMILALHLKRFKYMDQLHRYTKLSYRVVFPLELRLFNTSGDATNPDRMYDLVAVVVHCGRWDPTFDLRLAYSVTFCLTRSCYVCPLQWAQPRPLHHHCQEPRLLAPLRR